MLRCRRTATIALGLAVVAQPALAQEEEAPEPEMTGETQACIQAYESAQALRRKGQLQEAKAQAIQCARMVCPEALSTDCGRWVDELELSISTIVLEVRDADGQFVPDVKVTVDDELLTEKLDGRAMPIDPGAHRLRVEKAGRPAVERQIVIVEGERNRKIAVTLPSLETELERPIPMATWVFGGVSVVGFAVGTIFLVSGLSKNSDLDECKPNCAADDVDAMVRDLAIGDIGLTVGVVSAAAALTIYLTRPSTPAAPQETALQLRAGWGGASLVGAF